MKLISISVNCLVLWVFNQNEWNTSNDVWGTDNHDSSLVTNCNSILFIYKMTIKHQSVFGNHTYLLQAKSGGLRQHSHPTTDTYIKPGPFHKWYNTSWSWLVLWREPCLSTHSSLHPPFQTDAPQLCPPALLLQKESWSCCLLQRKKHWKLQTHVWKIETSSQAEVL